MSNVVAVIVLAFALIGAFVSISNLIRIARKGVSRVSRARTAPERLDLFPPVVDLGAVQRTQSVADPFSLAGPNSYGLANTFAVSPTNGHADRRADPISDANGIGYYDQPHTLPELERLVDPEC